MRDPGDHAADLGAVGLLDGVIDAAQTERAQRAALLRLDADGGTNLGDTQRGHLHATSVTSGLRVLRSRYARSIPGIDTSSGVLPRRRAISSGRRNSRRPLM